MHRLKAAVVPVLMLVLAVTLAHSSLSVPQVSHFEFVWDVLLGAALGAFLSVLPSMAGFGSKRNALTGMLWVGGFVTMILVFYQYISLVTGVAIDSLSLIAAPSQRMRIVEGTMLGYLSFTAGRGRI